MLGLFSLVLFQPAPVEAASKVTYDDQVAPILRDNCFKCHNTDKKKAGLDLSTYTGLMAGGGSGVIVAAQDVDGSRLWRVVTHAEEPYMPPRRPKLPDEQLAVIRRWIEGGLLENAGSKAVVRKKPKVDLGVTTPSVGRPDGPPPMPNGDLLLEPFVRARRAGAVGALATSPWAPLVAMAGQKQVLLYHTDTLDILGILPFPEGFPYVIRFSRNGRLLLVGGGIGAKLGKVALYDVATGKRLTTVGDELDAVLAADLSPDQTQIALGGPSKIVRIYSTATGELLHSIKKHTDWVTAVAYSPDGVLLATGDRNGGVHVWEAMTARPYSSLKGHTAAVTAIAWRDDSNLVGTAGEDGQIMLWELEKSTRVRNWRAHANGVESLAFGHDGRLVSVGRDRTAKLWDASGKQQRAFPAFKDIALAVGVTHDMKRIIAGDFTGEVRVWNAVDGKLLGHLDANPPTLAERIEVETRRLAGLKDQPDERARVEKALARWKAAQINTRLLAAASRLEQHQAALETAQAEADALKTEEARLATELAEMKQKQTAATQAVNAAAKATEQANAAVAQAKKRLGEIEALLATKRSEAEQANQGVESAEAALTVAERTLKALEETAAKASATHDAAQETFAKAASAAEHAQSETVKQAVQQAQQAAQQTAAALAAVRKAVTEYQSQVGRLTAARDKVKSAAAQALQAVAKAEQERDAQNTNLQAAQAAAKAASEKLAKAKAESEALAKKVQTLAAAVKEAQSAAAEVRGRVEQLSAELPALKEQHRQLAAEYRRLKSGT